MGPEHDADPPSGVPEIDDTDTMARDLKALFGVDAQPDEPAESSDFVSQDRLAALFGREPETTADSGFSSDRGAAAEQTAPDGLHEPGSHDLSELFHPDAAGPAAEDDVPVQSVAEQREPVGVLYESGSMPDGTQDESGTPDEAAAATRGGGTHEPEHRDSTESFAPQPAAAGVGWDVPVDEPAEDAGAAAPAEAAAVFAPQWALDGRASDDATEVVTPDDARDVRVTDDADSIDAPVDESDVTVPPDAHDVRAADDAGVVLSQDAETADLRSSDETVLVPVEDVGGFGPENGSAVFAPVEESGGSVADTETAVLVPVAGSAVYGRGEVAEAAPPDTAEVSAADEMMALFAGLDEDDDEVQDDEPDRYEPDRNEPALDEPDRDETAAGDAHPSEGATAVLAPVGAAYAAPRAASADPIASTAPAAVTAPVSPAAPTGAFFPAPRRRLFGWSRRVSWSVAASVVLLAAVVIGSFVVAQVLANNRAAEARAAAVSILEASEGDATAPYSLMEAAIAEYDGAVLSARASADSAAPAFAAVPGMTDDAALAAANAALAALVAQLGTTGLAEPPSHTSAVRST